MMVNIYYSSLSPLKKKKYKLSVFNIEECLHVYTLRVAIP